ncbi:calcium uniporter regulatory subunit MCUb, mitochondrial isoform X2 [Eptesicus fuscus]|uniref:calcium uniporter regulatory subunit MCUb, mitochondrial isoform X2 n=1 Tax=Eptesicus fuscus TaxID=29078 RepID=UPI002403E27F|nr:calcium uniporter regulatory subunit MCUb, mitochondrial isoform X2 [Eptesicus fuscus]
MLLLRGSRWWRPRRPPTPSAPGRAGPRPPTPTPQVLCVKLCGSWKCYQAHFYSTVAPPDEVTVSYRHGLPLITLTLPSRNERCQFVVKPMLSTVGSFLQDLRNEDKGVKNASIFTTDGSEIATSTLMGFLLMNDFKLVINKITYDVQCPKKAGLTESPETGRKAHTKRFPGGRRADEPARWPAAGNQMWVPGLADPGGKNVMKAKIEARSAAKTSGLLWAGLALLSVQGGALAWLTWWVYSWDIMEPVTYFITFANSMVFFAYFLVTRQDYTYSAIKSRHFLHFFYKKSKQQHFDVVQYNKLKEDLAKRGRKRDKKPETSMREKHRPAASCTPPTGDVPTTNEHALDRNRTRDPSVRRLTLYPLSQTGFGAIMFF